MKKVEFCAAVRLAFDEFEFGDLSLDLTIGPRLDDSRPHDGSIPLDARRERRDETAARFGDPRVELISFLLSDHGVESLGDGVSRVAARSVGIGEHNFLTISAIRCILS